MLKGNNRVREGLSLPSFVDIVFLLLIFFIIYVALNNIGESGETSGGGEDWNLPEMSEVATQEISADVNILTFVLERLEVETGALSKVIIYPIWPDFVQPRRVEIASKTERNESEFVREYPSGDNVVFDEEPAVVMIKNQIQRYIDAARSNPQYEKSIAIYASPQIPFKLINFIIEQSALIGDEDKISNIRFYVQRTAEG